jgi:hypothetical protein
MEQGRIEIEKQGEMNKDLESCYKILRVKSTASEEEVRLAYEYLADAWNVDRFPDNPGWRNRAEAKQEEISDAYAKILEALKRGPGEQVEDIPPEAFEPPGPSSEEKRKRFAFSRRFKVALLAATAVILFGIFIWPTAYDHDSMKSGNRTYSIRINRITGETSYLDGGQWHPMPIPQTRKIPAGKPTAEKAGPPAPGKAPLTSSLETAAAPTAVRTEPVKPAVQVSETKKVSSPAPARTVEKPYAVQITALRDGEKARTISNQLRKDGLDARVAKADIKSQGVLYRILVGHFATREEALRYLRDKKIKDDYPGSFIQKTTR